MKTLILNSIEKLRDATKEHGLKSILLVADENTLPVAQKQVEDAFDGLIKEKMIFSAQRLLPDETALGKILLKCADVDFIIGVGSGVVNDLCRFVSFRLGLEYAIIATAASMDGYLSNVSPLVVDLHKTTFICRPAKYVVFMINLLKIAPKIMTAAGVGDIYGKTVCLIDWQLSHHLFKERYDEEIAQKVSEAAKICLDANNVEEIAGNTDVGLGALKDALILSGIAMNEFGDSRPASGAEHHIAHFWENDYLMRGKTPELHGACVGVATLTVIKIMSEVLKLTPNFEVKGKNIELYRQNWDAICGIIQRGLPNYEEVRQKMIKIGCPTTHSEIDIDDETYRKAIREAMYAREKYTVLRLCADLCVLDKISGMV